MRRHGDYEREEAKPGSGRRFKSEKLQVQTLPDYLRLRYGTEYFKLAGSIVVFVFMIPYTAAVFSSLSYMFTSVFNLPYMTSVVIMAFIGALYLVLGGYKAAAKVDVFQGGIMVLGGIVNAQRHLREVQRDRKTVLPQKLPNHYRISLHVDDEEVICTLGRQQGFHAYQLNAQDDDWAEKILRRAQEIRDKEQRALETQGNNQVSQ